MGQEHGVSSSLRVSAQDARAIARVMAGLATASRVRILARLREGACTVSELTVAVEMTQPAVSHQLRILRDLGLVVGTRDRRHTVYELHDDHVASLVDETLRHIDHLDHDPRSTMSDDHRHDVPHAHEHSHDGETHVHAHSGHDHEHVEHDHEHEHDGERHTHAHVHETGLEDVHEHEHA
jgi:ArsR family transcriptional regulator, nickel/cobalt-responsive transcriptional repressor